MNLKENYIRYFGNIVEQDDVMDKEVENPETGNKIKVKTAMQLPDSHPAHKEAEKLIGGEKAKPSGDKEKEKVKGQDLFKKDTKKSDEPKSDTSQDSEKNSRIEDKIQAKKIVRRVNVNDKIFFRKNPEGYAEQLEQTLLDIQDHADKMHDENLADEFYSEAEEVAMQVNDIANSGEDMSFDDFKQARLFIKHYENTLTGSKQSSPTASLGYRTGKNRGGGMYDNVNKSSNKKLQEIIEKTTNI
tara:strand:- start:83 stop:814 length:732 start_codon:yes stop_codon:yes gene_type:complete